MRVWALASCGGLLALSGCSTEPSNTSNPNAAPPDGDDAAQVSARPRVTAPSPTARPTTRSGQGLPARARLSPSVPTQSSPARPSPSQANQLRSRVQRLRAQQGARLAPNTPITTAPAAQATPTPLYANLQAPNPPADLPQPSPVVFSGHDAVAVQPTASPWAAVPAQPDRFNSQAIGPGDLSAPLHSATTNRGEVATASAARSYSTPLRHQGYSSSPQSRAAVLSAPDSTATRLHGGTLTARANQSDLTVVQAELPAPAPVSARAFAAEEISANAIPDAIAAPTFTAESSTDHQSSGSTTLALARQSSASRTLNQGNGAHQRQGETLDLAPVSLTSATASQATRPAPTRPAQAVTLPESLPLHSGAPRLSPPRSGDNYRPQNRSQSDQVLNGTAPEAIAISGRAELAKPAVAIADPPPALPDRATTTLGHQAQTDLETVQLTPPDREPPNLEPLAHETSSNSKGLPVDYCLSAPLPVEGQAQADTAPMPKFSPAGQINLSHDQGSTLVPDNATHLAANPCLDSAAAPGLETAPD